MQSNTSERNLVRNCIEELCKKEGFENSEVLVQRDFEFLCERIGDRTGILISLSTMKRLSNGHFARLPQIATLNAICQYIGYDTWQDFKKSKQLSGDAEKVPSKIGGHKKLHRNHIILATMGGMIVLALIWLGFKSRSPGNFHLAKFSYSKVTSNDLPNTVIFTYDVENVEADSFFIQQSWDKNRRVKVDKYRHTLTDIYYEPGYHVAKLIANDSIIKTVGVSIPTDRWVFYAKEHFNDLLPKYISTPGIRDGSLQLQKEDAVKNLVNIEKENLFVMVYFPTAIRSGADNFVLRCRVRVNEVRNNPCSFLMCEIFAQKHFMYFKTNPQGCSHGIMGQFGNTSLNGKTADLSALAMDVAVWQNIEIIVKNKHVSIRVNSREVYSTQYTDSCGLITGLGFISNGLCQVDFVDLKTLDGELIYSNEFNHGVP